MKSDCRITICGDICPTPDTEDLFMAGCPDRLFNGLNDEFKESDLLIGNLEFPLTDIGKGIEKCGPVLKGKRQCISVLKNAGFDALGLANNHIRDCGDEGVRSTLETCREAGIDTVGAGPDPCAAREPLVVDVNGWKVGVFAFAEHEFNLVSERQAGANPLDLYYSFDQIREVRTQCDYLIVLYHGGIEYYEYPSPVLQKKCRRLVESGADLVLCQHSHCIGTEEKYQGGTILYGQGNTVFGYRPDDPDWNSGLLVKVLLKDGAELEVEIGYLPISATETGVDLLPSSKKSTVIEDLRSRSLRIEDKEFILGNWEKFCQKKKALYLPLLFGLGRNLNRLNRVLNNKVIEGLFSTRKRRIAMNLIRCESHREVVESLLRDSAEDRR